MSINEKLQELDEQESDLLQSFETLRAELEQRDEIFSEELQTLASGLEALAKKLGERKPKPKKIIIPMLVETMQSNRYDNKKPSPCFMCSHGMVTVRHQAGDRYNKVIEKKTYKCLLDHDIANPVVDCTHYEDSHAEITA